jgi:hypothetical protein
VIQEAGFELVVIAPERRTYQMVLHEVRPGWMRRSLRGAEELPIHAQGQIFLVGSSPP